MPKNKSLYGYTYKNWDRLFLYPYGVIEIPLICDEKHESKNCVRKTRVKITIQEISDEGE